jgi:hypothetical protein
MSLQTQNTTNLPLNPIHISNYSLETLDKKVLSEIYWTFIVEMSSFNNTKDEKLFFETIYDPTKNTKEYNDSILEFLDTHIDVLRKSGKNELLVSVYEFMFLTLNVTNRPTSLPRVLSLWEKLNNAFEEYEDHTTAKWFSELPIKIEYEDALNTYNYLKYLTKARPWFM